MKNNHHNIHDVLSTSFDRSLPFFGLNSIEASFEINSNLILKSGNEPILRSIKEFRFDALVYKLNIHVKVKNNFCVEDIVSNLPQFKFKS